MKILLVGSSFDNIKYCKEHSHSTWEIVIPTKNNGIVEACGQKNEFSEGFVYVIPPNINHTTYSGCLFSDTYIQVDDIFHLSKTKVTTVFIGKEVINLSVIIKDSYLKRNFGFSKTLENATSLLIQMIYDNLNESKDNLIIKDVRNFLIDNISNSSIDMTVLTNKFGYNKDYLRKLFMKEYGESPLEYLNMLRISQAKDLLKKMKIYSIGEVSTLCGFNDPLYFSRVFKKKTGHSPKEYRKIKEMQI